MARSKDGWTIEYFMTRDLCGVTFTSSDPQSLKEVVQDFLNRRKIMPLNVAFWVIMIVWFLFGLVMHFGVITGAVWGPTVNSVLLFVLFGILGWQVFGPVIRR